MSRPVHDSSLQETGHFICAIDRRLYVADSSGSSRRRYWTTERILSTPDDAGAANSNAKSIILNENTQRMVTFWGNGRVCVACVWKSTPGSSASTDPWIVTPLEIWVEIKVVSLHGVLFYIKSVNHPTKDEMKQKVLWGKARTWWSK